MTTGEFVNGVFSFIENTYGGDLLNIVRDKGNRDVVDRILADSLTRGYTDEKTGNKIIAMLRINP